MNVATFPWGWLLDSTRLDTMTRSAANGDIRHSLWRSAAPGRTAVVLLLGLLATLPTAPVDAALVYFQKDYAEMGHVWNTTQGICAAAANINSFVYLWNHFPGVYGDTNLVADTNGNGVLDYAEQVAARDLMAWGWTSPTGVSRPGIYGGSFPGTVEAVWESTYWWFNDFVPGTSVLDGQARGNGTGSMVYWDGGSVIEFAWPSWQFFWDSLSAGLDIELGIRNVTEDLAHAVTLVGLAFDDLNGDGRWSSGENPVQIGYLDPNDPSRFTWANVTSGVGGRLEFVWWQNNQTFYIYRAFTEGPALIPGDATGDGVVNELDAARLAANWGFGDATWAMGDFDGDDVVSAIDASILAANWGYGTGGAGAAMPMAGAVPEPSAWLLLVGLLPVCFGRRIGR